MATEFKLELDIKDLTKSIDALGSIGSQLDSVVRKIKDAQDKVAAKNISGLSKLVKAAKRKQTELAEAFGNTKLGKFLDRRKQDIKLISKMVSGVTEKLNKGLSIARNIGLSMLGAASAALYFSKGTTKEHSDARSQGFSNLSDKKSFEYANERTGRSLDMSAFNNALYTNTEGYDAFATLGLSKSEFLEMANKKGTSAAFAEFVKRITDQYQSGAWENDNKEVYSHKLEAIGKLSNLATAGEVKSFYGSTGYGSSTDWLNAFLQNIWRSVGHENLIKNDRAMVDLGQQLAMLKNKLVDLFAPELEKAVKGITEGLQRLHKWLNSEEGKAAMERFKEGLTKLSAVIKDVLLGAFVGIAKMMHKTGIIDLDSGTLEWLESISPQKKKTTEDTNKDIREGKRGFFQGAIDSLSGRSIAAYRSEARDISSTANYLLAMNKGKLPPELAAKLQKAAEFTENSAYTNTRYFNKEAERHRQVLQEVKIVVDNKNGSEISMISSSARQ